jgi:hypothetical protein
MRSVPYHLIRMAIEMAREDYYEEVQEVRCEELASRASSEYGTPENNWADDEGRM